MRPRVKYEVRHANGRVVELRSMAAVFAEAKGSYIDDIVLRAGELRECTGPLHHQLRVVVEEKLQYARHRLIERARERWGDG